MGNNGMLPGEKVKMGSKWDSELLLAALRKAEQCNNSDTGSLLPRSLRDPPVQTRGQVPGQLLSVSLGPALSETAL